MLLLTVQSEELEVVTHHILSQDEKVAVSAADGETCKMFRKSSHEARRLRGPTPPVSLAANTVTFHPAESK